MRAALAKQLDWCTIQLARLNVRDAADTEGLAARAQAVLDHPDFLGGLVTAPKDLRFVTKRRFQFASPVPSPWKRNNTVHGRLYTASKPWPGKPTLVLLHGWNAQTAYRTLFPHLARRLTKRGVNVAMLWGISLGAWLSGMLVCVESRVDFAVLMTPVARMDRLIAEVDFCAPIRRSLGDARVRLDSLNLATHRPKVTPNNILVVASEHDLFAPIATLEELCEAWGGPELWRPQHGHISVLMSMSVMERTIRWVARKA